MKSSTMSRALFLNWAVGLVSLFVSNVQAQTDPYSKLTNKLNDIIRTEIEDKSIPAISIALVHDQRIAFARGYGKADPAAGADQGKANAQTVYRVGSVSKLFTDLAVMQLVEKGQLDLDVDVTKYLPDFKPKNPFDKKITLRQLMSHRSGLVRESPVGHYFDPDEPTVMATVESLNDTTLIYQPESRTKYSNAGITVVGAVLEKVTGKPFEQVIEEAILTPLEMNHSSFRFDDRVKSRFAQATMWTYDGRTFPAPNFKLGIAPAGNLYSSVEDLSRFMMAVFNKGQGRRGRILSEELLTQMTQPQFSKDKNTFGIGFSLSEVDGHTSIGHGGAVYGFSTQWIALPEKKVGVITAASKDVCNGMVRRISNFALRGMLAIQNGKPLPDFEKTGPVGSDRIRQIVGTFGEKGGSGSQIQLFRRGDQLVADLGQYRRRIKSTGKRLIADDEFGYGPAIEFDGADTVRIDKKTYHRQANAVPKPIPDKWKGLVGEYGWDHNTLYIYEKRGRLWCTIEWFFQYPLTEVEPNVFSFPDYGLYHGEQLIFKGDGDRAKAVEAAKILFERRETGTTNGETFKIDPVKPIDEIRQLAMKGKPPVEKRDFRQPDLVELVKLDPSIKLDVRYASNNNFMGATFYPRAAAYMQRPAAEALVRVHRQLKKKGYGLLIHDAYRPWYVTKMFWDATPADMKIFVANPQNGSRHNRGCAVDLTLFDLKTGEPIWMGAGYDEFSTRSFPDYEVDSSWARWHRELLRTSMEAEGFAIYEFEWWHFDYKDWEKYPILNKKFD